MRWLAARVGEFAAQTAQVVEELAVDALPRFRLGARRARPSSPASAGAAARSPARAPPPAGSVRPRHVAWAELLRRTFGLDVLACPDCGGRLRLVATIAEPRVIARILAHLGLPLDPPGAAPPRQPRWLPDDAR